MLQIWQTIYEFQPKATLHIYSDINNKWSNDVEPTKMNEIKQLLKFYLSNEEKNNYGIFYHGWVSKKELADGWKSSSFWLYPCTFMETFCLTALEAALSKTFVITNDLAALQNTVGDRGIIIKGDPTTNEWKTNALNEVFKYLDNNNIQPNNFNEFIAKNYNWATSLSWENQANKLLNNYISKNLLEYKNIYTWYNNFPTSNDTQSFLDLIIYINTCSKFVNLPKINILEIGGYNGISAINLVKKINKSILYSLNMQNKNIVEDYIYNSFEKNILIENVKHKIFVIQNNTSDIIRPLMNLNKQFYQIIYIINTVLSNDFYTYMVLSWELLVSGGIFIIDNFYMLKTTIQAPLLIIQQFMEKYKNEFKLLKNGYRIFLEKI